MIRHKSSGAHAATLFRFDATRPIIVTMSIFIDESYSHPPKPEVYTIAGYVSEDWRWKQFEREWRNVLTTEGLEYLHMVEFAHKKGIYADWSERKRQKLLRTLHYIIHSNTIIDFSVNVVVEAYNELITPGIRVGFGEPHVFAVIGCMKTDRRVGEIQASEGSNQIRL